MKLNSTLFALLVSAALAPRLPAQVPSIIDYRSTIAVGGTNFHGIGQFKFALIDRDATQTLWSNDRTSAGASEPRFSVALPVANGAYEVRLGDTTLTNMLPVPPTVFTNLGIQVRVWFSDGTLPFSQVVPDQSLAAVGYAMLAANVADGAVTGAKLAAEVVTADKLAAQAVTADKLAPHAVTTTSISPGAIGAAQLAPNAAAANLQSSGGLILSDQSTATNLLAAGFQKIGTVLSESDQWQTLPAFAPSPRAGHVAVWTGTEMIIWGGRGLPELSTSSGGRYDPVRDSWTPTSTMNAPIPVSLGARAVWTGREMIVFSFGPEETSRCYDPAADFWRTMSASNAPPISTSATVIWTGNELIVWSGSGTGRRYDPVANVWRNLSSANAPTARTFHSAVWTGTEMIIWGGEGTGGRLNSGAHYDPVTDTWKPMSRVQAPAGRSGHSAVWTGKAMVVYGGGTAQSLYGVNTGGSYDPVRDTWTALATNNTPAARRGHVAFWTGTEMLVWGGVGAASPATNPKLLADGGRYDPAENTWAPVASGPLETLAGCSAVWTGTEMMIWGGGNADPRSLLTPQQSVREPFSNLGARYHPATDEWRPLAFAPVGRVSHSAVWTGDQLIIWGGSIRENNLGSEALVHPSGGRFNPASGHWLPLSALNAPTPRNDHQAIWTGAEMVVWGGQGVRSNLFSEFDLAPLNTGARYNPATDTWRTMETNGAPSPRSGFVLAWTDKEAVVFGGRTTPSRDLGYLNTSARYDPQTDSWATMTTVGAPTARQLCSAVWTGKELIIWGGEGPTKGTTIGLLNTGARYNPSVNQWTPMTTTGSPAPRAGHSAIWTGREVIIWGGIKGTGPLSGARYDPALDRWAILGRNAPTSVPYSEAVWTGEEMIVWGGQSATTPGWRYHPATDTWTRITTQGAPKSRWSHQAVWTGNEMLIFGGLESPVPLPGNLPTSILRYSLTRPLYLYRHP
jgi:N-acetylneuraminic acid mutarotase